VTVILDQAGNLQHHIHMRASLFTGVLLFFAATVAAQVTPDPAPQPTDEPCILATTEAEWMGLGLNAAQIKQVMAIQTNCKTDCGNTQISAQPSGKLNHAAIEKHEERVREIMDADQFRKWKEWCEKRPSGT
jgi:hypothetical protein